MQITLELPEDLAQRLGADSQTLSRTALEALALEGIRSGKLSKAEARRLLGIPSRYEMDGFLKDHGYTMPITLEDVERDTVNAIAFSRR
jgi:hypothetical protein